MIGFIAPFVLITVHQALWSFGCPKINTSQKLLVDDYYYLFIIVIIIITTNNNNGKKWFLHCRRLNHRC